MSENVLPSGRTPPFAQARAETIRYHRELYATTDVGEPGSWLAKPHHIVLDALDIVDTSRPITAYDLRAGVGRHTRAIASRSALGSTIIAVDLLPEALEQLTANVPADSPAEVLAVVADLADFEFDRAADLIVAFSAVEHLASAAAIREFLDRAAAATAPSGVVAIGIVADRRERTPDGQERAALLESGITSARATAVLAQAFADFTVLQSSTSPAEVTESRDGRDYVLASNLVVFLAQRPAQGIRSSINRVMGTESPTF